MTYSENPIKWHADGPVYAKDVDVNFSNCMRWAGNWADPTPDSYAKNQVVRHEGGSWVALQATQLEPNWAVAQTDWQPLAAVGRGGLAMSTQPTAGPDIGAAWAKIAVFDADYFPVNFGFTSDVPNDQWSYQHEGLWMESITLGFAHNELNASRTTQIRIWNSTDSAIEGQTILLPIARNQSASFFALSLPLVIGPTDINKTYEIQIGNGDSITSVSWTTAAVSAIQMSIF